MLNYSQKISLVLIFLLVAIDVKSQESFIIKGKSINVREEPSLKAKILGTIPGGEVVSVTNSENPDWWLISYFGNEGYVSSKLLESPEESEQFKNWKKQEANTGDNPECENISPQYDKDLDNKLIVHVGYNYDVVVKVMTFSNECIRIAYIKSGDTYSITHIPEGNYYLKLAYGKDYRKSIEDGQCKVRFLRDATYKKSGENLDFYKVRKEDSVEGENSYKNWEVPSYELSLNIEYVKGGFSNFNSNKISEGEFNK
jgi:uncharacterized protein YgiM (DUF1202 family)